MQKKVHLLSSLKKQVLQLKTQLDQIDRNKRTDRTNHRSTSESSRFSSNTFGSSYLDKGVKKFPLADKCRNLVEVIKQKSVINKTPSLSPFRKFDHERTKQNFSSSHNRFQTERSVSPNPVTGFGYTDKRKGIKTIFPPKTHETEKRGESQRKHFSFYFY